MKAQEIEKLTTLSQHLGYDFTDVSYLQLALTHRSKNRQKNNQRLEFLGDAILGAIISDALCQRFPDFKEGLLSRLRSNLVCRRTLASVAMELQVSDYLQLGQGELKSGGRLRESTLCDAIEAIIAAIYVDGGFSPCQKCVLTWFDGLLNAINVNMTHLKDPKSRLQESMQSKHLSLPKYKLIKTQGQSHQQQFMVSCELPSLDLLVVGEGNNRRDAEQMAASLLLDKLNNDK